MFKFFESSEKKLIKSHLRHLVRLAMSDGHVSKEEADFIKQIASKNDVSASELKEIMTNPTSVEIVIPSNNDERFDQIFDLVNLMMKDGEVLDAEMEFCAELANRLGFRQVIVGVLVGKIERGIKEGLSRQEIKKEAAPFINY